LRIRDREGHQTLDGADPELTATILFNFVKSFRNFKATNIQDVDKVLTYDFVGEKSSKV